MPLYEYECADCRTVFEKLKPMGRADDPESCPVCQGAQTERLLSAFATATGAGSATSMAGCGPSGGMT